MGEVNAKPCRVKGFRGVYQYAHWKSVVGQFDPTDYFGFVYLVENTVNGKLYIGKKQLIKERKVKVAGRKNRKVIRSQSDWLTYMGSSEYLTADIKEFGADKFNFYIVGLCKTKGCLRYTEANLQHKFDVLITKSSDGRDRQWYNAQIDNVKFIPSEFCGEAEKNVAKLIKSRVTNV